MKWTLVMVCILALHVTADSDLDTVKQLLTDLKTNVQLDIEALDSAWALHSQNKQSLVDALGLSESEQRSECQKKDDDVQSKKRDIKITNDYIAWLSNRQVLNSQRLSILEINRCQASNNYVHDIKNYKIALALVQFLKDQLDKLEGDQATKTEFLQKVSQFVKKYHTGKLLTMVENLQQNQDGSFILPNIEGDEQDLNESILTNTRGQRNKNTANKIFLQQQVVVNGDGDDKADSAVVLIPGQCDDSINTVVVVQNDDGTNSDDDINIRFTNGGGSAPQKPQPNHKHHQKTEQPQQQETQPQDDSTSEQENQETTTPSEEETTQGEEETTASEEETTTGEEDTTTGEEDTTTSEESITPSDETTTNEQTEDQQQDSENDNGDQQQQSDSSEQQGDQTSDDEDLSTIRKVLDAIEKHTKKSLDLEQEDEVRSSMIYIDFKLHIELENQTFDKYIASEKENLIKLNNQLTSRVSISRQCNARLQQITIAHQVSQEDYNDSYQHYLELRKAKEEELATFDDVYRIYTNQVV